MALRTLLQRTLFFSFLVSMSGCQNCEKGLERAVEGTARVLYLGALFYLLYMAVILIILGLSIVVLGRVYQTQREQGRSELFAFLAGFAGSALYALLSAASCLFLWSVFSFVWKSLDRSSGLFRTLFLPILPGLAIVALPIGLYLWFCRYMGHTDASLSRSRMLASSEVPHEPSGSWGSAMPHMPSPAELALQRGKEAYKAGHLAVATQIFHDVTVHYPNYAEGHHLLGAALEKVGRWGEALACYQRAHMLQPSLNYQSDIQRVAAKNRY